MPFVCGGFPSPGVLPRLLPALQDAGASVVEIGFPFSDPIADGPVIAEAMHTAIAAGSTAATIFSEVESVRPSLSIGLVAMVSISLILRLGGPKAFATRAAAAGFDGLIVPDVPLEESAELRDAEPRARCVLTFTEQYRNLRYGLEKDPRPLVHARTALRRAGLKPVSNPIRGGTDGSNLTARGLPTPNLFVGMHEVHSPREWVSLQDMEKSAEVLVHLAQVWAECPAT